MTSELQKSIIYKKLLSEKKYIDTHLDDIESIFNEFIIDNGYVAKNNNDMDECNHDHITELNEEKKFGNIKKLFTILSMKLHPDKNGNSQESIKSFSELNVLYKNQNLIGMIKLAKKYNIDVSEFDGIEQNYDVLIKELEKEINETKQRIIWMWFFEKDDNNKLRIIEQNFVKNS